MVRFVGLRWDGPSLLLFLQGEDGEDIVVELSEHEEPAAWLASFGRLRPPLYNEEGYVPSSVRLGQEIPALDVLIELFRHVNTLETLPVRRVYEE